MGWIRRLRNTLHGSPLDATFVEEARFHLEERIDEYVKNGMTHEQAETEARRRLGNLTLAREQTRDADTLRWLEDSDRTFGTQRAAVKGTPLNGPRTLVFDERGDIYLALREGNQIYRIAAAADTLHHVAGTGKQRYSGDGGPARAAELGGPKGLAPSAPATPPAAAARPIRTCSAWRTASCATCPH